MYLPQHHFGAAVANGKRQVRGSRAAVGKWNMPESMLVDGFLSMRKFADGKEDHFVDIELLEVRIRIFYGRLLSATNHI